MTPLPAAAKAEWFAVRDATMETVCPTCGEPLLVGDQALEAYGDIFCSVRCVKDAQSTRRQ